MTDYQIKWSKHLSILQEEAVQTALARYRKGIPVEAVLYEVTYEVLEAMMETLDGYTPFCTERMDVVTCQTGVRLREGTDLELHDQLEHYLRS